MMSKKEQPVSERIKLLLDTRAQGNKAELGRAAGVSGQAIADLIGGKKGGPSFPVLQKLLRTYPDINPIWLILGEGDMLKSSEARGKMVVPEVLSGIPSNGGTSSGFGKRPARLGKQIAFETTPSGERVGRLVDVDDTTAQPQAPATALPGTDLIQQVASNTADIQKLFALVEAMSGVTAS